jgi:hypothetical protein
MCRQPSDYITMLATIVSVAPTPALSRTELSIFALWKWRVATR